MQQSFDIDTLIALIVANNLPDVAEKLNKRIGAGQLTEKGAIEILKRMWNAGKKDEVFEILNVPYKHNTGPENLIKFMAAHAKSNDTVINAHTRSISAKPMQEIEIKNKFSVSIEIAAIVLLVVFIFFNK